MKLNKIKIDNAEKWDIANYDEFLSKGIEDLPSEVKQERRSRAESLTSGKANKNIIIS